jgi:hypothetical protein
VILDAEGMPRAKTRVTVTAYSEDGAGESFGERTDEKGVLLLKGSLRAGPMKLRIEVDDVEAAWRSDLLDGSSGTLDLGEIVIGSASRDSGE